MERFICDDSTSSDELLVARATSFSNIFTGSRILSALELESGYTSGLFGGSSLMLSEKIPEAYKDLQYSRALQRLLKSRHPNTVIPNFLNSGTNIYYHYKSSKQNEPVEWKPGTVGHTNPHYVQILNDKQRKTDISCEDIRIRPKLKLTQEFTAGNVKDYIQNII